MSSIYVRSGPAHRSRGRRLPRGAQQVDPAALRLRCRRRSRLRNPCRGRSRRERKGVASWDEDVLNLLRGTICLRALCIARYAGVYIHDFVLSWKKGVLLIRCHRPHISSHATLFQDAFGLKPVDVVADLTTTDLVKRALSISSTGPQGLTPRSSRQLSASRSTSPLAHTSTASLSLDARVGSAVLASVLAAGTISNGEPTTAPTSRPQPRLPRSSSSCAPRVGFEPSRTVDKEEATGGADTLVKSTGGVPTTAVDDALRVSWTRPIGPRPEPPRKSSSGPRSRSKRQLAVCEEKAMDSEAPKATEAIANGGEAGDPVKRRCKVADRRSVSDERAGEAQQ